MHGYWTWESRARQPGQPRISKERPGLIARIATENPRWGAVRIQGELLALGYEVSAETVRGYRRRRLRREVSTRSFCHRLVARRTASRRAGLGFGIGRVS